MATWKDLLLGSIYSPGWKRNIQILSVQWKKIHFGFFFFFCKWKIELQEYLEGARAESVDVGEYAVGDSLAVLFPRQAILLPTVVLIAGFPVHQQDGEINHIEIRQNVIETWG